jgi:hypothetical protein
MMTTENKKPLGMIFPKMNSKTGKAFFSGYVEINGVRTQLIANKATKPDQNGNAFYVIFENDRKDDMIPQKINPAKAKITKATVNTADDESAAF